MRILIVGGTGKFGAWFVPFFKRHGFEVLVSGKSGKVDVARQLGCEYVFLERLPSVVPTCDWVMLSVPIDAIERVASQVAPHMKEGSMLFDVCSLKQGPLDAMLKVAPEGVEVVGTHPMFGPTIPHLEGQTVIMVSTSRSGSGFERLRQMLEEEGAHVQQMSAREHDMAMAVVQGLTHFAYITIGSTLRRLEFDVGASRTYMSPVYEVMVDFVGRILAQNPYLYALIQTNPAASEVRRAFVEEAKRLASLIDGGDVEGFVASMRAAASHFGNTEAALRRSDKLINWSIAELERLQSMVGKEVVLEHLYTSKYHRGVLKSADKQEVVLGTGKRQVKLKLENVRMLEGEELSAWRAEHVPTRRRDISVLLCEGAREDVLVHLLSSLEHVARAEVIDVYELKGKRSATFRLHIFSDAHISQVEKRAVEMLVGLGCTPRGSDKKRAERDLNPRPAG
ncbi:prephenate dehydrogenase [Methermicoccus shengliensis]|uniref:Prephenate dehydrogenase n=1 Tax=Methermicoccus shengliensis TaxID=660064 RepID=A0A832RVV5_9EURY|nr:MAG: Prephenate dehydrogenase [Methanosarcinales archeaon 56_1174]HIH69087.1 prephenate dehydrogenase [Methermicoccus shengliensis]